MTLSIPFPSATEEYGPGWLRYLAETGLQEGVVGAGDLKVAAAAAGGMRIDVAAGTAFVKGDAGVPETGVSQGLFMAVNSASIPNAVTLPASNGSNPRIDQIALRVRDKNDLGDGVDDLAVLYLAGSATAGATLDNRNGAAALPASHVRLADIIVPAGSTAVAAGNIRDRRPWARGFSQRIAASSGDFGIAAGGSSMFGSRFELTPGNNIQISLNGQLYHPSAITTHVYPLVDNTVLLGTPIAGTVTTTGTWEGALSAVTTLGPTAGSRLIGWFANSSAVGGIIRNNTTQNLIFHAREIVSQNGSN
jgi:hypothetical protein